jgi:hypothetical protein
MKLPNYYNETKILTKGKSISIANGYMAKMYEDYDCYPLEIDILELVIV